MTKPKNKAGGYRRPTAADLKRTAALYLSTGENVSEVARTLDMSRNSVRNRLTRAAEAGYLDPELLKRSNDSTHRSFERAVAAQKDQFNRVEKAGTYRTPRTVDLPDDKPFVLIALGDPHLDNKGTDLNLWDRWIEPLGEDNVRGVCLGDMTDNWLRFLGFLYANAESTEEDAWVLLQGYMEKIGPDLDALVGGNHDLWKNEGALRYICEQFDVRYRAHGVTLAYRTPMGREITVGMRHRFAGHSQWNTVHAITKAAMMGWRANVLIGGDKHISGQNWVKDPVDGKITHCHQLAAFKVCDDYAESMGFQDQHITPAVALVIDPRFEDDDPRLIKTFHDAREAADYCEFLRSGNK